MNKWLAILLLLLATSVALNLQLLNENNKLTVAKYTNQSAVSSPAKIKVDNQVTTTETNSPETYQTLKTANNSYLVENEDQPPMTREQALKQAYQWLKQENYADLTNFLQSYLKQHPQDMEMLLIEAKLKIETSLLSDAIAHYYSLLRHPMTTVQQSEVEEIILQLSNNTINQLKNTYSWDVLAKFVEPLIQIDPENRLYILSLARAYAEQYQELLMENILASLPFEDPSAQAIRKIVAIEDAELSAIEDDNSPSPFTELGRSISLKQYGDQYVVKAKLSDNEIDLLIDTGASITVISKHYFDNLSNRYKTNRIGRFSVNTANGSVRAPMYKFRELTINHVSVENISVMVLPMSNLQNANGLLGMNFLREFDFKIDQTRAVIMLK
ncbi:TIGR02281 family clan AA aspartic protease [Paraglaciecola sp. L3A3]|uniref:retropepsin-like aspartic protease family protein n=1 Tax=Paraglaciecola sp. L3A3 TaxID=2686358 RepID=UPI00131CDECE|nr:retropepsin-like aspartic protease [Paraglaciecola sp. L3A3]